MVASLVWHGEPRHADSCVSCAAPRLADARYTMTIPIVDVAPLHDRGVPQKAAQGIARQPEAKGDIQTTAIIFAALIEGVALFGIGLSFVLMTQ